jgi:phosphate transport system substrate-binding protein
MLSLFLKPINRLWGLGLLSFISINSPLGIFAQEASPVSFQTQEHLQLTQLLQSIEPYRPIGELQGKAVLAGSTTMQLLGQNWSQRFKLFHPQVEFERGAEGSDAGLEALAKDANTIVGISRGVTESDMAKLKAGDCKDPIVLIVALDPMAIYVHKSNPIAALGQEQIQKLFGASADGKANAKTWGDLGVSGPLASQAIRIHHRSEVSGTRNFIRSSILGGAHLAEPAATHTSNVEICKAISQDPAGVGMCGFGDGNEGVRTVALMMNQQKVEANESSFLSGSYPLVRPLSLVFDKTLVSKDKGLRESVLRYILSRDGQSEAIRAGFYPLDPNFIRQEIAQLSGTQMR